MKTLSSRAVASLAALSLAVTPAAALAATHTNSSLRKQAEKYCRAQDKSLGKAKFTKKYGPKNAMGKCVSTYEKKHKKSK
jgi:hypothetical protein